MDADNHLLSRLGAAVRAHRLQLGVTQEELAWRADLHRTYIADIERGRRNITMRSIANLARALQVPAERLIAATGGAWDDDRREILLVEDNQDDVTLALHAFRRAKFTNAIRVISDGQEALHYLFRSGPYARLTAPLPLVVLLDLNLPKVPGVEILRQAKANPVTRAIPIVVLTVSRADSMIIECGRLGAENYIIKPVDFVNLSQVTPDLDMHWTLMKRTMPVCDTQA